MLVKANAVRSVVAGTTMFQLRLIGVFANGFAWGAYKCSISEEATEMDVHQQDCHSQVCSKKDTKQMS